VSEPPVVSAVVPANPEFVHVLRNVAAGVAARLDMAIDQIEEVRLAVTEAASLLLEQTGATSLRLTIHRDPDTLDVRISSDGRATEWPSDQAFTSWPWRVVRGLSDDVQLDRDADGSPAIAFRKRSERVAG
jgi:serine/threonine-protein kinase RsbW